MVRQWKPDVAHFHNTFPLISPSAYYACQREGVPVVQTLHNYRLLCPTANLFRAGRVCEDCLGHSLVHGIAHACYRSSRLQTATIAAMLKLHRMMGTWNNLIDAYIALTEFGRQKHIDAGLPPKKIYIKGNFSYQAESSHGRSDDRNGALFIGRLEPEKGISTLISAWRQIPNFPLAIVGAGSLETAARKSIESQQIQGIKLSGQVGRDEIAKYLREARVLVLPSEWYEGFPIVIVEAYAAGLPVIASRIGGLPELVRDGKTGLLFKPGDVDDLARNVRWIVDHPREAQEMGQEGLALFRREYSPMVNYSRLMDIYQEVVRG
jgi:glycosyltransferase involved in cell wall biosynthesis